MRFKLGEDDKKFKNPDELARCYELMQQYKEKRVTEQVAKEYAELGKGLKSNEGGDQREHRALEKELVREYGVTEVEAINILNGRNISDYIRKYEDIANGIFYNIEAKSTPEMQKEIARRKYEEYENMLADEMITREEFAALVGKLAKEST